MAAIIRDSKVEERSYMASVQFLTVGAGSPAGPLFPHGLSSQESQAWLLHMVAPGQQEGKSRRYKAFRT